MVVEILVWIPVWSNDSPSHQRKQITESQSSKLKMETLTVFNRPIREVQSLIDQYYANWQLFINASADISKPRLRKELGADAV